MEIWYDLILWVLLWSGIEAFDTCGTCLQPPAFTSNFTTMTAQSDTESTLTIHHDLGEVPVKVEVQVRPPPGRPDTEYVFPGIGSAQADDDLSLTYAGVVYKYNSQQIVLTVPKKSNNNPSGTIIYTGENAWIGPKSQREQTAEIRVKLWTNCTFPAPDFESVWFLMVSKNATHSYKEIKHGLGEEPEYVSVQIKHFNQDWYTDGIGSSSRRTNLASSGMWGGLIFGSNDTHIRTWAPHLSGSSSRRTNLASSGIWGGLIFGSNDTHIRTWAPHLSGTIFSAADGWGLAESWISGWVKVRVWKTFEGSLVFNSTTFVNSGLSVDDHQISTPFLDISSGMIDVKVKVNDGSNSGFSFPGTGAVQNAQPDDSYGGVVYSYSTNGVRFWHPHLSAVGSFHQNFLVLIDSAWGGSINQQASTSCDLVIRFWNYTRDGGYLVIHVK
ncbi:uncharacterized protein [Argopecten irradians]|uniref:uncharacterized protein isoform X2 n=1 Tax=Argopecten irradians TaxID=31199 RepID=UPI00371949CC